MSQGDDTFVESVSLTWLFSNSLAFKSGLTSSDAAIPDFAADLALILFTEKIMIPNKTKDPANAPITISQVFDRLFFFTSGV